MIPDSSDVLAIIDLALAEDVGEGDWTTLWTVPAAEQVEASIVAKSLGVVAGTDVLPLVFHRLDPAVTIDLVLEDGDRVQPGQEVARIRGSARSLLTGERVALNFLQRLSGVATATRAFADAIADTPVRILDTRKTTPGMRRLEKRAVLAGGGANHRFGLDDMVLVKENHIRAAGGIAAAIEAVRRENIVGLLVEVETTDLEEVREALRGDVDRILFDNMPIDVLRQAVEIVGEVSPYIETEASGGVTLENVRAIAETGVHYISVGALTHSAPALDLSLLVHSRGNG